MDFQSFNSKEFLTLYDNYIVKENETPKKLKIKFIILDVYKGLKYKDTGISEISDF